MSKLMHKRVKRCSHTESHRFCGPLLLALRDLYESMDKTSSSIPPIILLQFLHMAFPQFAEKGDQGQYLQQVRSHIFGLIRLSRICSVKVERFYIYMHFSIYSGCQ